MPNSNKKKKPAKIPVAFRQRKREKMIFEARSEEDGRDSFQDHFDFLCRKDAKKLSKEKKDEIDKIIEQEEKTKPRRKKQKNKK